MLPNSPRATRCPDGPTNRPGSGWIAHGAKRLTTCRWLRLMVAANPAEHQPKPSVRYFRSRLPECRPLLSASTNSLGTSPLPNESQQAYFTRKAYVSGSRITHQRVKIRVASKTEIRRTKSGAILKKVSLLGDGPTVGISVATLEPRRCGSDRRQPARFSPAAFAEVGRVE